MAFVSEKPIVLYSTTTGNGISVSILLEELKEAYGNDAPEYDAVKMSIKDADIGKVHNQVKSPWFVENVNPNGRIPAITHDGFPVFETSAILVYLANEFDKERKLSRDPVKDPKGYSIELQWLFFVHGGVGPMQGQASHFSRAAPEKIPYAIDRYINETKRLYSVLESRLEKSEYLAGDSYGIADIKPFGWVRNAHRLGLNLEEYPKLKAWLDKVAARPAVQRGLEIPA